jgi:hypothetical protein
MSPLKEVNTQEIELIKLNLIGADFYDKLPKFKFSF